MIWLLEDEQLDSVTFVCVQCCASDSWLCVAGTYLLMMYIDRLVRPAAACY